VFVAAHFVSFSILFGEIHAPILIELIKGGRIAC